MHHDGNPGGGIFVPGGSGRDRKGAIFGIVLVVVIVAVLLFINLG
jgi:hypothetical protein